jgi:hypothetical protein
MQLGRAIHKPLFFKRSTGCKNCLATIMTTSVRCTKLKEVRLANIAVIVAFLTHPVPMLFAKTKVRQELVSDLARRMVRSAKLSPCDYDYVMRGGPNDAVILAVLNPTYRRTHAGFSLL